MFPFCLILSTKLCRIGFHDNPRTSTCFIKKVDQLSTSGVGSKNHLIEHLPVVISSGVTRSPRSGSSPYQNIQSSLAAARLRGGGCAGADSPKSYRLAGCGADTRRHTHKISAARQRAQLRSTGSSSGSQPPPIPPPPPVSHHTSLRHFIPESSVCKKNKNHQKRQ